MHNFIPIIYTDLAASTSLTRNHTLVSWFWYHMLLPLRPVSICLLTQSDPQLLQFLQDSLIPEPHAQLLQ